MNKKPVSSPPEAQPAKPYFTRFLEEQELSQTAAGRPVTLRYPSDHDEF